MYVCNRSGMFIKLLIISLVLMHTPPLFSSHTTYETLNVPTASVAAFHHHRCVKWICRRKPCPQIHRVWLDWFLPINSSVTVTGTWCLTKMMTHPAWFCRETVPRIPVVMLLKYFVTVKGSACTPLAFKVDPLQRRKHAELGEMISLCSLMLNWQLIKGDPYSE